MLRKRSVCPHPPAPPLTPLPPAAVAAILLAEGYVSLAADWHLEWMSPETLEEGVEPREDLARGRSAGLIVNQRSLHRKRCILVEPIRAH